MDGLGLPNVVVFGAPLVVLVPAVVQLAKELGLPTRYAGLASIGAAGVVLGLVELRTQEDVGGVASWLLMNLVYGLAAAGFYSQAKRVMGDR
jgi:hypothetical protein